jgi:hypothetical protein
MGMRTERQDIRTDLIPERIKRLFWDVDKGKVDPELHRFYVIRRIMDHGSVEDVRWMKSVYSSEEIAEVVKKSRGLSRKSAHFGAAYFSIAKEEVECLKTPYRKNLRPF